MDGVGEAENGVLRGSGGDGGRFQRNGGLVGVDLDEDDEEVDTGDGGIVSDDIVGEEPQDGCFDVGDGFLVESRNYEVSEGCKT